ncbi:uncharacterized protein LOC105894176 [Clupea harengus]|uniref:Uncharacterized protein LOC105894176 n=1 Tax=Clupea harengus TaxID=7950 RepID=A0A6P8H0W1_CLUHA|nr:uncharacterized protein LOC105894176 [Clupea harengus]
MEIRTNPFSRFYVPPFICAASLAATAMGTAVFFYRWRKETAEIGTQTEWETVEVGSQAGWETAEQGTQSVCVTAEAETQSVWETAEAGTQAEGETAEAGTQAYWETSEVGTQATWESAEADTQADWTDVFFLAMKMASHMGLLDAEHGPVLLCGTQEVQNTRLTVGFEHAEWFSSGPRWVEVKLTCTEKLDESLKRQWFVLTNTFHVETPEGGRVQYASVKCVTYIKRDCGKIIHVSSHMETDATFYLEMAGVLMVETSTTFKGMTIAADGTVSTTERTHTVSVPAPTFPFPQPGFSPDAPDAAGPDVPCLDSAPGPDGDAASSAAAPSSAQGSGDSSLLPEATQVPSLYHLFLSTALEDFALRLNGLREAFAVLLAKEQGANFVFVAGKMILRNVATLSGKDAGVFQQEFDQLLAFLQSHTIETELLEVGIHSVNLLDVVFEMVFFGELEGARARLVPRAQGGFLDHLVTVIHAFLPSEVWPHQAARCWELLRADVLVFLVDIFSLDLSVYSRPQDLSDVLFSCLEQRVDQLLSRMPAP